MKSHILNLQLLLNTTHSVNSQIYTPNATISGSTGNNNVGIGTNTPTSKLHVVGTITAENVVAGKGVHTDGSVLLKLNTDRPWQFIQTGDEATASLALQPVFNMKVFTIMNYYGGMQLRTSDTYTLLGYAGNSRFITTSEGPRFTIMESQH